MRYLFSLAVIFGVFQLDILTAQTPHQAADDFQKYAMRLRENELLKIEPQVFTPSASRLGFSRYPWKRNIVTTVFWVGEHPTANNPVANYKSSWDPRWAANFGGLDDPDIRNRRGFIPAKFVPRQNPFYVALPYNDVTRGTTKPESRRVIPWFRQSYEKEGPVGSQGALGGHSTRKPDLLRAMGGLRSVSHGPLAICFWQ